jgi:O-antigen/teichoic acid export membrane protein
MSRIKELASDTAVYGLSSVVARFLNYLLVPFYTAYFAPGEYGVISLIYAGIVFLNVLFTFGMESSYIRYASQREGSQNVFRTIQTLLLGVGSILAVIMLVGSGWVMPVMSLSPADSTIYILLIGILWFDALSVVPYAELRLVRKSFTYAGYRLANVGINLTLNIYLVAGLGLGIEAVLWSNLAASAITAFGLWVHTWAQLAGKFDIAIVRQVLFFGLPYVPNGLGFAINEVVDRFFLNAMSPESIERLYGSMYSAEDITGIYNACYKLAIFMLLTVQMFRMAWQPFFMKYATSTDNRETFAAVFDWFNLFAGSIFLLIALFVADIAALKVPFLGEGTLINHRYWAGLSIVPLLLLAYWLQGWFVIFSAGIFIKEKTKLLPGITLVGAIITITLNYLLVPTMGMNGAAIATLVCYAVISGLILYYSHRELSVPYRVIRALASMVVVSMIVAFVTLSGLDLVESIGVRVGLSLIGILFVFYILRPTQKSSN